VYETYDYTSESSTAYGKNLYRAGSWAVNNSIDNRRGYGSESSYAMRSWIGRINYDFMERYFASVSLRTDGSSRFHKDNRWGTFWSISGAWNLGKEKFLQDQTWIDFLKLRASFGQQGNDNIGNGYAYVDQYQMTGSDGVFSDATLTYKGNKDLTWEKSNSFDVAVDFEFWKGRLSGTIDFYNRDVDGLIYEYAVPTPPNLYNTTIANGGTMRNRGIEILINAVAYRSKSFEWNTTVTFSYNKNELVSLNGSVFKTEYDYFNTGQVEYSGQVTDSHRVQVGESIGNFWGFKVVDVDDEGRWIYEDRNGERPRGNAHEK
jgi:outer membrane cobalamin receptor